MIQAPRPIDVVVNSTSFADVRVYQPYNYLQQVGWDVRLHIPPFDLNQTRSGSLVIWQRPIADSVSEWFDRINFLRKRGCLVLVEWDDHPDLFMKSVRERCERSDYYHLKCCHGLQTSTPKLAKVLSKFNSNVFVVDNAVNPIPAFDHRSWMNSPRIFLGNLNREREQSQLASALREWLQEPGSPHLVVVGPSGLEGLLPAEKVESHPPLSYVNYRQLLASCHLALLPLQLGEPQSCKTPIKWMEAAAESVVVVAGPELYGSWLEQGQYGLYAPTIEAMIPLARGLIQKPELRLAMAERAHARMRDFSLEVLLPWRMELYRHLDRLAGSLEYSLQERCPLPA